MSPQESLISRKVAERSKKFFYASELNAGMFDVTVDLVVPQYRLMHETMVRLLDLNLSRSTTNPVPAKPKVILDIGSGTGADALYLLEKLPSIKVVAIDFSAPMNDVFRKAFARAFPSLDIRECVRFIDGDIVGAEGRPDELRRVLHEFTGGQNSSFDAVVTALTLHHLDRREKLEAYSRAFDVLKSGGVLLNGDLFSYEATDLTDFAKEFDMNWIKDHFQSLADEAKRLGRRTEAPHTAEDCRRLGGLWQKHYEEDNLLNSAALQEQMLRFVGFRQTGVPFRFWQVGVLWAWK